MPVNILMPALSPTMEKGNLAKWVKKEGDKVKPGDVIAEIETDKATMEVEAVDEGVLAKIVVPEGTQDVPVNQLIAVLATEGEDAKTVAGGAGAAKPAPKAAAAPAPSAKSVAAPASPVPQPVEARQMPAPVAATNGGALGRIFASPLARRLAKEANIDIARLAGSGPHGRIVASDIDLAKKGGAAMRAPGAGPAIKAPSDAQIRALYEEGSYESVPHDSIRKTIARRLVESKLTIPAYYLTIDCEIDVLLKARAEVNSAAPKVDGKPRFRISVNDFIIKAMALALIKVPNANVTWTETGMLKHKHADVGVAVALEGGLGLITPIVRRAEEKTLSVISNEMRDLAARARTKKLRPHEFQGGATSISNLGMYGIRDFIAVINPPQSSILAVGVGEERMVVKKGKPAVATVMTVTLSGDHRAIDGALGAELLGAFKNYIENPVEMLA
jgi:pyruvate dehydrogenase E2 component (dihydrolipoamide acetyltransferase)